MKKLTNAAGEVIFSDIILLPNGLSKVGVVRLELTLGMRSGGVCHCGSGPRGHSGAHGPDIYGPDGLYSRGAYRQGGR